MAAQIAPTPATGEALLIFDMLPPGVEVIRVREREACPLFRPGDVAVYEADDRLFSAEPVDGGVYVIEYQRPIAGMSWEAFHERRSERVVTDRHLVRVFRSPRDKNYWVAKPLRLRFGGAIPGIDADQRRDVLCEKLIGRVVGLYRPHIAKDVQ